MLPTPREKKIKGSISQYSLGTTAPWYEKRHLSEAKREFFRERSRASARAKKLALSNDGPSSLHPPNSPRLNPDSLMPIKRPNGLTSLSLFSGGGGLDLGFDRAGFKHMASYEVLSQATQTLQGNRPGWTIHSESDGDVRKINWSRLKGQVDVLHGGPPCQPFSTAGRQKGAEDGRDLFPEFVRAVLGVRPKVFLAENVGALGGKKFERYLEETLLHPLRKQYNITVFALYAKSFGVPQQRKRMFFVGVRHDAGLPEYVPPNPTHRFAELDSAGGERVQQGGLFDTQQPIPQLNRCMGVREALGLPDIGYDNLAPTIRCTLTGPRHTTSILSSVSALFAWKRLGIWPNGVAPTREMASKFVTPNGDFRLSVPDCALLQGFPETWRFVGAVYMALGQIGNSVAPPVAYNVALSIAQLFSRKRGRE